MHQENINQGGWGLLAVMWIMKLESENEKETGQNSS